MKKDYVSKTFRAYKEVFEAIKAEGEKQDMNPQEMFRAIMAIRYKIKKGKK